MNSKAVQRRLSLALTGASGVRYGIRMLQVLTQMGHHVDWLCSDAALRCLQLECDFPGQTQAILEKLEIPRDKVTLHDVKNIASPLASGSALRQMHAGLIVPCSMGTLARIAMGHSGNLIERHADVLIKERKPLVLVPRETPLSEIHLENLLRLCRLGCHVVPAMPGFYHQPKTVDDLVDHVIGKALDVLSIEHQLFKRWGEKS